MKWTYDRKSDVMYITFGEALPCRTVECEGVCIRQHGSTLNGITIVNYSRKTHDSGTGEHISQQPHAACPEGETGRSCLRCFYWRAGACTQKERACIGGCEFRPASA